MRHNFQRLGMTLLVCAACGSSPAGEEKQDDKTETRAAVLNVLASPLDFEVEPDSAFEVLRKLEAKIRERYAEVPSGFRFEMIGGDLQLEGITRNQRITNLAVKDKTVAEILTTIIVQMNPDRRIRDLADPNQLLVWTIGSPPHDPDGQIVVLITTRAAAAKRGYPLPAEFVPNVLKLNGIPLQRKPR